MTILDGETFPSAGGREIGLLLSAAGRPFVSGYRPRGHFLVKNALRRANKIQILKCFCPASVGSCFSVSRKCFRHFPANASNVHTFLKTSVECRFWNKINLFECDDPPKSEVGEPPPQIKEFENSLHPFRLHNKEKKCNVTSTHRTSKRFSKNTVLTSDAADKSIFAAAKHTVPLIRRRIHLEVVFFPSLLICTPFSKLREKEPLRWYLFLTMWKSRRGLKMFNENFNGSPHTQQVK